MNSKPLKTCLITLLAIIPLTLSDCKKDKPDEQEFAIVNIKAESEWDYLFACKTGDYFLVQEVDSKPTTLMLHLKEKNADIPFWFNENGFPVKAIINNCIVLFENFNGNEVDIALIHPSGEIEYARKISTQVNWNNLLLKSSNSFTSESDLIRWAGRATGAFPCAISVAAAAFSGGWLIPLAVLECGSYALEVAADIIENEYNTQNGFTEFVNKWEPALTIIACSTGEIISCWSSVQSDALSYMADQAEILEQNQQPIHEASSILKNGISVSTDNIIQLSSSNVSIGIVIKSDWGVNVAENGIYWGKSGNPSKTGTEFKVADGTGIFTATLSNLEANTTYFVEPYAKTNLDVVVLGEQASFTTLSSENVIPGIVFNPDLSYGSVKDVDGNTYRTIQIGSQTWMAENLRVSKYNDQTPITLILSDLWYQTSTEAYCYMFNDEHTYKEVYGGLYNWYAVNTKKLCPQGWHVPSNDEWKILEDYLGGANVACGKLKEMGISHWSYPNVDATNESGFTALPGGARLQTDLNIQGGFNRYLEAGYWWTSSEIDIRDAIYVGFVHDMKTISHFDYSYYPAKKLGLSVRCVKD